MKNWISKLRGIVPMPPEETPEPTQWLTLTVPLEKTPSETETQIFLSIGSSTITITVRLNPQLLKQVVQLLQETC